MISSRTAAGIVTGSGFKRALRVLGGPWLALGLVACNGAGAGGEAEASQPLSADALSERRPGEMRWVHLGPTVPVFSSLDTDLDGSIIGVTRAREEIRVEKFDADGHRLWGQADPFDNGSVWSSFRHVSASPSGEFCAFGKLDRLGPPPEMLACFQADGTSAKAVAGLPDDASFTGLDLGPAGERLTSIHYYGLSSSVSYRRADGSGWRVDGDWWDGRGVNLAHVVHLDASQNAIVPAVVHGNVDFQGHTFGETGKTTPAILKFGRDGVLQWARTLDGLTPYHGEPGAWYEGSFRDVATVSDGSIVSLGVFSGTVDWGNGPVRVDGQSLLTVTGADGSPKWAKAFPDLTGDPLLAVDPSGKITVVGMSEYRGTKIYQLDLTGDIRWQKHFTPTSSDSEAEVRAVDVTSSNGAIVLSGSFVGGADFGLGAVAAPERRAFLLKLQP